jgi:hypothetical protein
MLGLLKDEGFLKAEDGVVAFFQLGDGAGVRLFHFVDQRSVAVVDTLQQVVRMRGGVEVHILGAVEVGDAGEWFFFGLPVREGEGNFEENCVRRVPVVCWRDGARWLFSVQST